jgi:hypothetical protein
VASRNKRRRGHSRKRRRAVTPVAHLGASPAAGDDRSLGERGQTAVEQQTALRRAGGRGPRRTGDRGARRRGRGSGGFALGDALAVGERPRPPWYPLPLSELLILVGAIGTVIGLNRGLSHGGPPLIAGLAAVVIGTVEVTLREHLSGYRAHTVILALLATIAFHTAVVFGIAAFTPTPRALNIGLLVVDVALFTAIFKALRARFRAARRERVLAGDR